jgi:hypothetical protein
MTLLADIIDISFEGFVGVAIHEKPIAVLGRHGSGWDRIAPHENWRASLECSTLVGSSDGACFGG